MLVSLLAFAGKYRYINNIVSYFVSGLGAKFIQRLNLHGHQRKISSGYAKSTLAEQASGTHLRTVSDSAAPTYAPVISRRTIAAPSTIAFILPKATVRGKYLRPQSGATIIRSAGI